MMDPKREGVVSLCKSVDSSLSRGQSPSHIRHSRNRPLFGKRKEEERGMDKESKVFPVELDVTCGRGKHRWNSKGNKRYRVIIMENIIRYQEAKTKSGKSRIVRQVVEQVQENKSKFLKRDQKTKLWTVLTPTETRTKVAHALRDHIRICCSSSMSASNLDPRESESIESTSHKEVEEREFHHMTGSYLPNPLKNKNVTTKKLSSSAHLVVPSWAAPPSNSSVVLRAASIDGSMCAHEEKEEPVSVIMAPSWQPVRISLRHLEDGKEQFSPVGGSYLDLPNVLHQPPFQESRPCGNQQHQDCRKNDGMSMTQLSGVILKDPISSCVCCTLPSGGEYDPTGGGRFQVGNNQNVRAFGVCSCRNIGGAITMAVSSEPQAPTIFRQHKPDTLVCPFLSSTNGPACGQRSITIGSCHQANDAMSICNFANLPMHMEGYPVAKPTMAVSKNFSVSQLIGGTPMSRATGAFDSVDQGHFPWLNYVNETQTPPFFVGGRMVNEKDSYTFQSALSSGAAEPTINHNLGEFLPRPLPFGMLNSVSSFPGVCDDAGAMDDSYNCGERVGLW